MAASEFDRRLERSPSGEQGHVMEKRLRDRLEEEVARAERLGGGLSCMLMVFENLSEIKREHGEELGEQVIEYVAKALRAELRSFDRVCRASERELVMIVPGAQGAYGEIVARRALERMRAIKVEAGGTRLALTVSVGLATWRADMTAQALLARARAALERLEGDNGIAHGGDATTGHREPTGVTSDADGVDGAAADVGGADVAGAEAGARYAPPMQPPVPPPVGRGTGH